MAMGFQIPGPTKMQIKISGGVLADFGYSRDGFSVRLNQSMRPVICDQFGDVPGELIYRGGQAEISGVLVKWEESILADIIPLDPTVVEGYNLDIGTELLTGASAKVLEICLLPAKVGQYKYTFSICLPGPMIEMGPIGSLEKVLATRFLAFPHQTTKLLYTKVAV